MIAIGNSSSRNRHFDRDRCFLGLFLSKRSVLQIVEVKLDAARSFVDSR